MGISQGLLAAYKKQDYGSYWVDLTNNGNGIALTGTSWVADGLGAYVASARGNVANEDNSLINSEEGTIVFGFKSASVFIDGTRRYLFGNSSAGYGRFVAYKEAGSFLVFLFLDGTNHYITIGASSFPNWQTGNSIALVWKRDSAIYGSHKMAVAVDGEFQTVFTASGSRDWTEFDVNEDIGVLNDHVGSASANGAMEYLYIFNTAKTEEELTKIHNNHHIVLTDRFKRIGNYNIITTY